MVKDFSSQADVSYQTCTVYLLNYSSNTNLSFFNHITDSLTSDDMHTLIKYTSKNAKMENVVPLSSYLLKYALAKQFQQVLLLARTDSLLIHRRTIYWIYHLSYFGILSKRYSIRYMQSCFGYLSFRHLCYPFTPKSVRFQSFPCRLTINFIVHFEELGFS